MLISDSQTHIEYVFLIIELRIINIFKSMYWAIPN